MSDVVSDRPFELIVRRWGTPSPRKARPAPFPNRGRRGNLMALQ